MFRFLPAPVKSVFAFTLIILNTLVCVTPLFFFAILKLVLPLRPWRRFASWLLVKIAETWISINNLILASTQKMSWEISGMEGLEYKGWYLVVSNHQTWADILVLQRVFNRKIPFLKFFLKQQLIWVPIIGLAWWALDFPFMKRYSKEYLKKHPELRGKDLETTKKACEKFRDTPVSVMNFVEGTRFSTEKRQQQQSPFRYLLKPRAGGVSFVVDSMGDIIREVVNVTIVYPEERAPTFMEFLGMKESNFRIIVSKEPIPHHVTFQNSNTTVQHHAECREWINHLWQEKDQLIADTKGSNNA